MPTPQTVTETLNVYYNYTSTCINSFQYSNILHNKCYDFATFFSFFVDHFIFLCDIILNSCDFSKCHF